MKVKMFFTVSGWARVNLCSLGFRGCGSGSVDGMQGCRGHENHWCRCEPWQVWSRLV